MYLGKPTAGKKEEKPLLIPDFVDMYLGSTEPEEQEIGSSGGAQVIVRAFNLKPSRSRSGWGLALRS